MPTICPKPAANLSLWLLIGSMSFCDLAGHELLASPPPNDTCAGAIPLVSGIPHTLATAEATSTGDPAASCASLGRAVWFTFTAAGPGVVSISTCGSDFDTLVQAFTGTCGSVIPVPNGCNDDGYQCADSSSLVHFTATAGATYYILAGGFSGASGNLAVTASLAPPVAVSFASSPASGVFLTITPADVTGQSGGLTPLTRSYGSNTLVIAGAAAFSGAGQFLKWQMDGTDYTNARAVSFRAQGPRTLTAIYKPTNDVCAGAIELTNGVALTFNTANATTAGDPPIPAQPAAGSGVWFSFTPTQTEQVTVSTCGSAFDTALQVFNGECGALRRVAGGGNDNDGPACPGTNASVVFYGIAGTTHRILATGAHGETGNLRIQATSGLVNGTCATALPLAFGIPVTLSTSNAPAFPNETIIGDCPGISHGVWFTFDSPVEEPVVISTCGSSFDTKLSVLWGTCGQILTNEYCSDNNGPACAGSAASVVINASPVFRFYILVGGANGERGTLTITAGPPPSLSIARTAGALNVSWPPYYWPGYVLQWQSRPQGAGLGVVWMDWVTGQSAVTIQPPPADQDLFFRLVTP